MDELFYRAFSKLASIQVKAVFPFLDVLTVKLLFSKK